MNDTSNELTKELAQPINPEDPAQMHEEVSITGTRFLLIIVGLVLSIFVAAIDNTIVSTAMTKITSEFNALDQVTWVASSYLLTTTALQPLYGKFSDIFGRKPTLLFALVVFLGGSIACGASTNIIMLIIFRAISGIGGGGLIALAVIIISDIVPMKKRGIYMGMVGANFAVASVVGPLLGGVLTDRVSWRWAFYINIPICAVAIVFIFFFLDLPTNPQNLKEKLVRIDYGGTLTLVSGIILLVLGLSWGGNEYPWRSSAVIATIVLGGALLILFAVIEKSWAKEPIIPGAVLKKNVVLACAITFLNGAVFFNTITYIPIYYQVVKGESAISSGLELLPMILGLVLCTMFSGVFTGKTGIYCPLTKVGTFIALLATCLLGGLLRADITRAEAIIFLLLMGIGIGLCIQTNTIVCQAAVPPKDAAVVTALVNFTQSMGGVLGLAILGAVFQNVLYRELELNLPTGLDAKVYTTNSLAMNGLDRGTVQIIHLAYIAGFRYMFLVGIGFLTLSFLLSLFLTHIPLDIPEGDKSNRPPVLVH